MAKKLVAPGMLAGRWNGQATYRDDASSLVLVSVDIAADAHQLTGGHQCPRYRGDERNAR